jgi:hypothetical protein
MTLAFVENDQIIEYPIGVGEVRRKFPSTSFILPLEGQDLTEYGVVTIENADQPEFDSRTQRLVEGVPAKSEDIWQQTWEIVDLTQTEIQAIYDTWASGIRNERNDRLSKSDWTQLPDSRVDADVWATYRQMLRDVPQQSGFPWDVQWPTEPN